MCYIKSIDRSLFTSHGSGPVSSGRWRSTGGSGQVEKRFSLL